MKEPEDGSIVCWFDPNGDVYAVMQRSDNANPGEPENWYPPVGYDTEPMAWAEALNEYKFWHGPCLLESQGRVE